MHAQMNAGWPLDPTRRKLWTIKQYIMANKEVLKMFIITFKKPIW